MSRRIPTYNELRSMLHGAAIGARMAVGPTRWCELHPFFEIAGWVASAAASLTVIYLAMPLWQRGMAMIINMIRGGGL